MWSRLLSRCQVLMPCRTAQSICPPAARLLLPFDASVSALRRNGKGNADSGGSTGRSARSAKEECPVSRRCPFTEVCSSSSSQRCRV